MATLCDLRSQKKVEGFRSNLMKLHDDLADLKSYFDGQKDCFDEKKLFSIGRVQCPQIFYIRALPDLNSNSVNRKLETSKYIPHN